MNKDEFMKQIDDWYDSEEHDKIIEAILALPDSQLDDDILGQLAVAYNNTGEFKKAIAVLESQRPRLDGYFKWHYRMGYALYYASKDEECDNDEQLSRNILERARTEFARCMNMNPPEDYLEDCDMFMERIEAELDDNDEEEDEEYAPEMYDEEEMNAVEEHIKEYFGEFPTVLHEIYSPDIHVDVCIIPPTKERNYYTLVTMGMGAHIMNIPEELSEDDLGRAELLICLPPDWKVGESDEEWFWPIGLLKNLARLPGNCDTWLGWAHSVDNRETYADNTALCGALLIKPEEVDSGADCCELPNGDIVNFFEVIPIYREEMQYKIDNSAEALLKLMSGVSHITDINRPNCCEGYEPAKTETNAFIMDNIRAHIGSIRSKGLPIDEINACNHLSNFLRWCIENSLMAPEFNDRYPKIITGVLDGTNTDLRRFITEELDGALSFYLFSYEGACFADYYYSYENDSDEHFYPADVDSYAEQYFGTERYNSDEFQDEAYLFIPFDENYYQGIKKVIDKHFKEFSEDFDRKQSELNSQFAEKMEELLDCPCVCCSPEKPEQVKEAFEAAKLRGQEKGFTPILFICDGNGNAGLGEGLVDILSQIPDTPLTIAEIPVENEYEVQSAIAGHFGAATQPSSESAELAAAEQKLKDMYGISPCVVSLGEDDLVFFFPDGGGRYVCLKAGEAEAENIMAVPVRSGSVLNDDEDNTDIVPSMIHFLGCKCRLFAPVFDDTVIIKAYREAQKRGKSEGFVPMLVTVDETLWERLVMNTDAEDRTDEYGFDADKVSAFRRETLAAEIPDGKAMLDVITAERRKMEEANGIDPNKEIIGEIADEEPLTRFLGYWDYSTKMTRPLILAEIPVKNPWEVFAYLPFGGWNDCPNTPRLIAAAKYWYETHGAVPAVISRGTLEFDVPRPMSKSDALPLALEMYGFCADIRRMYGKGAVGKLAGSLHKSSVWYFHWG